MNSELKHNNLYFFDKNGEYLNLSYSDYTLLVDKPYDWDYNRTSYYKISKKEYVHCSETEKWSEELFYQKSDCWSGDIYLDDTSTGIFSVGSILILEKDSAGNFRFPFKKDDTTTSYLCGFLDDLKDIFLFTFNKNYVNYTQTALSQEPDGPDIERIETIEIPLSESDEIRKEAVQLNFALCSYEENTFKRTLYIYEQTSEETEQVEDNFVAIITIYGKTVNEDERLKTICENFGYNIIDTDSIAFEKTNVKEILPDWTIINEKRKEIILEGHNIYPYIGAYKGIINAIKYFGYNELQLREFWKNVDRDSPYYGKYVQTDCINFLSVDNVNFNQPKITLPSKQYRKTSLFSLVYKINDITEGKYDEDGLPLTHENQVYTQEEILIKLFALKRKLEKDFLPLNARIKDIVGEADFFALNELTSIVSSNVKNNIQVGIAPDFTVINGEKYSDLDDKFYANLVDLRTFLIEYFNSTSSLVEGSPAPIYDCKNIVPVIQWWNMFVAPREQYSLVLNTGSEEEPEYELVSLKSIIDENTANNKFDINHLREVYLAYFKDYNPNIKFTGYWEDGKQPAYLNDIDPLPENWKFITNFEIDDDKRYVPFDDSGSGDGTLCKIDKEEVYNKVPVGALVILKNTTFDNLIFDNNNTDDYIDSLSITYDELAKSDKTETFTFGIENYQEYDSANSISSEPDEEVVLSFSNIFNIKHITTEEDTVHSIMYDIYEQCLEKQTEYPQFLKDVTFSFDETQNELNITGRAAYDFTWKIDHPMLEDAVESEQRYSVAVSNRKNGNDALFTWNNIQKADTTLIEWTIKKELTEVSPAFYWNSGKQNINEYNEIPVVLPYVGTYTIEMRLYNMYNHLSSIVKKDIIEVIGREIEISGWYTSQEENKEAEITEEDTETNIADVLDADERTQLNVDYTWETCGEYNIDEFGSTWQTPIKPETLWNEVTADFEGLNNANVIENNLLDYDDANMHTMNYQANNDISNNGSYMWKNCNCAWDEGSHKSWNTTGETGDIPYYFEINRILNIKESDTVDESDDNRHLVYNYSNPILSIKLTDEFVHFVKGLTNIDEPIEIELHAGNSTENLIDIPLEPFYTEPDNRTGLKERCLDLWNLDLEKYLIPHWTYADLGDYVETISTFVSDKKMYLTQSDTEFDYYVVDGDNSTEEFNIHSCSQQENCIEIDYLKQIADVEFTKSEIIENNISVSKFTGYVQTILRNTTVSRHSTNTERVPIINWYTLTELEDVPTYTVEEVLYEYANPEETITEQQTYYVDIKDMEQLPNDFDTTIAHNTLNAWKYYYKKDGNNITYYQPVPCLYYKVKKYVKYEYKPESIAAADKLQLVGKYNSELCNVFDIDLIYTITYPGSEEVEMASYDLEGTGIKLHYTEIHNPTWNNVKFINTWKKLPKLTRICFTYDKCKILGKRDAKWTIKNLNKHTEKIIQNKYCTYLFNESGKYSITLELYDSNKNKYIATKNYLTII